jgi:glycogenin glucosyltransferase
MEADPSTQAWVTLATNDSYALGALVLASSLKRSITTRKIVIMVTPEGLSQPMKSQLKSVFDEVVDVSLLDSKDKVNLALLERPDLGVTFTKLHCWCLVQYTKCVFLDADTMVITNSDDLFDRSEFSAAPDAGWPDCFNSGVFVFAPSRDTFNNLMTHAATQGSFDGGDQGLLNSFFSTWATQDISKHLPFLYNMCANATYTYQPAYKHYGHNVRIVHFIGTSKPWHVKFDNQGQPQPSLYEENTSQFLQQWWNTFHADVKPIMAKMQGETSSESFGRDHAVNASAVFSNLNLSGNLPESSGASASADTGARLDDRSRWDRNSPDYKGADSFDNILKKIDSTMSSTEDS